MNLSNVLGQLKEKMESNKGLSIFLKNAEKRHKFENWLQVELCEILAEQYPDTTVEYEIDIPEDKKKRYADIFSNNVAIQLKVLIGGKNYKLAGRLAVEIGIAKEDRGLIPDIKMLKNYEGEKKIIFIVFPAKHNDGPWGKQYRQIVERYVELKGGIEFVPKNSSDTGVIYWSDKWLK